MHLYVGTIWDKNKLFWLEQYMGITDKKNMNLKSLDWKKNAISSSVCMSVDFQSFHLHKVLLMP